MAKINRHFKIEPYPSPVIFWKKKRLCTLTPFSAIRHSLLNKTAFIIASGPSIKELDISPLKNKFTFGVNGSILKFTESNISPSFYVISDEDFIYNRPQLLKLILQQNDCHCFFTPQALSAICETNPDLLHEHRKITVFDNHFKTYGKAALELPDIAKLALNDSEIITKDGRLGFSLNPEKGIFTAHTVPYFALQLAYGLGFRTINLVGMDLGSPNGETRFYESGEKAMPSHLDRDYIETILPSFKIVGELCKNNTVKVFNLSPTSRLPENVIEKMNFLEAIKQA